MKSEKVIILLAGSLLLTFNSCKKENRSEGKDVQSSEISYNDSIGFDIKYAQGFKIRNFGNYNLVDIQDQTDENSIVYRYALVKKGNSTERIPAGYTIIRTPIERAVCMTTTQLSNFIKLDAVDKVVGLPSTQYLHNEMVKKRIRDGKIGQIGMEGNFDNELIISLNPEVIFVSPYKRGGYESIKNLDIPLIIFAGYKETTPLGQAEWIKFTGLLLGKEDVANEMFNKIERKYNDLKALCANVKKKPIVLSGEIHSGAWYVPGGKSYLAQQIRDAGAEYFLKDNFDTGGLSLDFETVYSKGANADFWRFLVTQKGTFSYDLIKSNDARYADFKPYKDKKVFYCNFHEKPYYENAPMEPEIMLSDLIKVFHPELLPDYKPVYYELLSE